MRLRPTKWLILTLLFTLSLTTIACQKPSAPAAVTPEESGTLSGVITDALMDTILITTEDGAQYEFAKSTAQITTENTGLKIGNPITIAYYGELDPTQRYQTVDVTAITVTDAADTISPHVGQILAEMTLEEKVGQLFLARCPEQDAALLAQEYHLSGYILFAQDFADKTSEEVIDTIATYQASAEIPLFIAVDEEGGSVNRVSRYPALRDKPFPSPQTLYAQGGLDAIAQDAAEKSRFLLDLGINLNFAPVCDISTDPNDFIYQRTLGQDAQTTAQYVQTVVQTMAQEGMGNVLKHFPGYGNNTDTHTGLAYDQRPLETFTQSDLLPFAAGIQAGADMVLVSHNIVTAMDEQRPASLSPEVHRILRDELNFSGVIITDDLAMDGVRQYAPDEAIAVQAIQAGNDLLCCTDFTTQIPAVLDAVQSGVISEEQIDESCLRILALKEKLGLLP